MIAGLAQTNAVGFHFANLEIASHQMIQRDAARDQVAPRLAGREFHVVVALEGFDRFGFDQVSSKSGSGLKKVPWRRA